MSEAAVATLKRVDVLSGLSDGELAEVAEIGKKIVFKKGDVVVNEGQPGDKLFVIEHGEVEIGVFDSLARFLQFTTLAE
jgi:CRP-like cAMP-binding protein